jgi:hypothetical protein
MNRLPASVRVTDPPGRRNSVTPRPDSSRLIRFERPCWVRNSLPAARPKCQLVRGDDERLDVGEFEVHQCGQARAAA